MKQSSRPWIVTISCILSSILLTELILWLDLVPILVLIPWQAVAGLALVLVAIIALFIGLLKWRCRKLQFSTRLLLLLGLIVAWPASRFALEARHERTRTRAQQACLDMALSLESFGSSNQILSASRYNDVRSFNVIQRWLIGLISQYVDARNWQYEILELVSIDLTGTEVSNDQLAQIAKTQTVQVLNLSSTKITDAGLEQLYSLQSLRLLTLKNTNVSPAATDALSNNLPGLTVIR